MLEILSTSFRICTIVLIQIITFGTFSGEKNKQHRIIILANLLCLSGYAIAYWDPVLESKVLFELFQAFAICLPFSLWILSKSMFDDEFQLNSRFLILRSPFVITQYLLYKLNAVEGLINSELIQSIPYIISIGFIILVAWEAFRTRHEDLIISRLKKRNIVILISALLGITALYLFLFENPFRLPIAFELTQNIVFTIILALIIISQSQWKSVYPVKEVSKNDENVGVKIENTQLIDQILYQFESEKIFQQEGMTIARLADILNEKEYIIRKTINGQLGYTNFNNFLNKYRIQEACLLMKVRKNQGTTIQEIAYEIGYQSIATFNRAFKKETGMTPSEYVNSFQ